MPKQANNKAINKTLRFGVGEYEGLSKGQELSSIHEMRSIFLQKASELSPEVLDDLKSELLEIYQRIPLFCYEADPARLTDMDQHSRWIWHDHNRPSWEQIETAWNTWPNDAPFEFTFEEYYAEQDEKNPCAWIVPFFNVPKHKDPNIALFINKMVAWSRRYNLDEMWCRNHAYETLDLWCYDKQYYEARNWMPLPLKLPFLGYPIRLIRYTRNEIEFKYTTLYPSSGFRHEVKREIMQMFEKHLDSFLDEREIEAQSKSMGVTPEKHDFTHFEWLASFQVRKMSYAEVLKEYHPGEYASIEDKVDLTDHTKKIRKAINELSKHIKLRLRKDSVKPGSKPKKKYRQRR